jgi:hypothetical protein
MPHPSLCSECRWFWQDGFHDEEHKGYCLAWAPTTAAGPVPAEDAARWPVVWADHPACGDAKTGGVA